MLFILRVCLVVVSIFYLGVVFCGVGGGGVVLFVFALLLFLG